MTERKRAIFSESEITTQPVKKFKPNVSDPIGSTSNNNIDRVCIQEKSTTAAEDNADIVSIDIEDDKDEINDQSHVIDLSSDSDSEFAFVLNSLDVFNDEDAQESIKDSVSPIKNINLDHSYFNAKPNTEIKNKFANQSLCDDTTSSSHSSDHTDAIERNIEEENSSIAITNIKNTINSQISVATPSVNGRGATNKRDISNLAPIEDVVIVDLDESNDEDDTNFERGSLDVDDDDIGKNSQISVATPSVDGRGATNRRDISNLAPIEDVVIVDLDESNDEDDTNFDLGSVDDSALDNLISEILDDVEKASTTKNTKVKIRNDGLRSSTKKVGRPRKESNIGTVEKVCRANVDTRTQPKIRNYGSSNAKKHVKIRSKSIIDEIGRSPEDHIKATIITKKSNKVNPVEKNEGIKGIVISNIVSGIEAESLVGSSSNIKKCNDSSVNIQKYLGKTHEEGATFKIDGQNFKVLAVADSLDEFKNFLIDREKRPVRRKKYTVKLASTQNSLPVRFSKSDENKQEHPTTSVPRQTTTQVSNISSTNQNINPKSLNVDPKYVRRKGGRPSKIRVTTLDPEIGERKRRGRPKKIISTVTDTSQAVSSNYQIDTTQKQPFNLQETVPVSKRLSNATIPVGEASQPLPQIQVKTDVGNILAMVKNETMTQSILDDENENAILDSLCFVSDIANDESNNVNVGQTLDDRVEGNVNVAANRPITWKQGSEEVAKGKRAFGLRTLTKLRKPPPKSVLKTIQKMKPLNHQRKSTSHLNQTIFKLMDSIKLTHDINSKIKLITRPCPVNTTVDESALTSENQVQIETGVGENVLELVENDKIIQSIVEDENENEKLDSLCFQSDIVAKIAEDANVAEDGTSSVPNDINRKEFIEDRRTLHETPIEDDDDDVVFVPNDPENLNRPDVNPKRKRGRALKSTPNSSTILKKGRPSGSVKKKSNKTILPKLLKETPPQIRYSLRESTKERTVTSYANLMNEVIENFSFANFFIKEEDQVQIRTDIDNILEEIRDNHVTEIENESNNANKDPSADVILIDDIPPPSPTLGDIDTISSASDPSDSTYCPSPPPILDNSSHSEVPSPNGSENVMSYTISQIFLEQSSNVTVPEQDRRIESEDSELITNTVVNQSSILPIEEQVILNEQPPISNNSKSLVTDSSNSNQIEDARKLSLIPKQLDINDLSNSATVKDLDTQECSTLDRQIESKIQEISSISNLIPPKYSDSRDTVSFKAGVVTIEKQVSNINTASSKSKIDEEIIVEDASNMPSDLPQNSPLIITPAISSTSHSSNVLESNETEDIIVLESEKTPSPMLVDIDNLSSSSEASDSTYCASPSSVLDNSFDSEVPSPNSLENVMSDTISQIVLEQSSKVTTPEQYRRIESEDSELIPSKSLNADLSQSVDLRDNLQNTFSLINEEVIANNSNTVLEQSSTLRIEEQVILNEQPPTSKNSKSLVTDSLNADEVLIEGSLPNSDSRDTVSPKSGGVTIEKQVSNIEGAPSKSKIDEEIIVEDASNMLVVQPQDSELTITPSTSHSSDVLESNETEGIIVLESEETPNSSTILKRGRGRPPASAKSKKTTTNVSTQITLDSSFNIHSTTSMRRRSRPTGSVKKKLNETILPKLLDETPPQIRNSLRESAKESTVISFANIFTKEKDQVQVRTDIDHMLEEIPDNHVTEIEDESNNANIKMSIDSIVQNKDRSADVNAILIDDIPPPSPMLGDIDNLSSSSEPSDSTYCASPPPVLDNSFDSEVPSPNGLEDVMSDTISQILLEQSSKVTVPEQDRRIESQDSELIPSKSLNADLSQSVDSRDNLQNISPLVNQEVIENNSNLNQSSTIEDQVILNEQPPTSNNSKSLVTDSSNSNQIEYDQKLSPVQKQLGIKDLNSPIVKNIDTPKCSTLDQQIESKIQEISSISNLIPLNSSNSNKVLIEESLPNSDSRDTVAFKSGGVPIGKEVSNINTASSKSKIDEEIIVEDASNMPSGRPQDLPLIITPSASLTSHSSDVLESNETEEITVLESEEIDEETRSEISPVVDGFDKSKALNISRVSSMLNENQEIPEDIVTNEPSSKINALPLDDQLPGKDPLAEILISNEHQNITEENVSDRCASPIDNLSDDDLNQSESLNQSKVLDISKVSSLVSDNLPAESLNCNENQAVTNTNTNALNLLPPGKCLISQVLTSDEDHQENMNITSEFPIESSDKDLNKYESKVADTSKVFENEEIPEEIVKLDRNLARKDLASEILTCTKDQDIIEESSSVRSASPIDNLFMENDLASVSNSLDVSIKSITNEAIVPEIVSEFNLLVLHENETPSKVITSELDPLAMKPHETSSFRNPFPSIPDPLADIPSTSPSNKPKESSDLLKLLKDGTPGVSIETSSKSPGNKFEESSVFQKSSTDNCSGNSGSSKAISAKKILKKCRNNLEVKQQGASSSLIKMGYRRKMKTVFVCRYCRNYYHGSDYRIHQKLKCRIRCLSRKNSKCKEGDIRGPREKNRLLNKLNNRIKSVLNRNRKEAANCRYCHKYVGRERLSRHQQNCLHSHRLKSTHPNADILLKEKMLDIMVDDEITNVLRTDKLLVLLGKFFVQTHSITTQYVRETIRQVGRYLLCIKSLDASINDFSTMYNPKYCNLAIETIKRMCKFEPVSHTYKHVHLFHRLAEVIQKCGEIHHEICVQNKEFDRGEMVEMFLKKFQHQHSLEIRNRMNKSTIPFEERKLLFTYTKEVLIRISKSLSKKFTFTKWIELSKAALMHLRLINSNISENPQNLLISDYENKIDLTSNEDISHYHNLNELKLAENTYHTLKMQEFNVSLLLTQEFCDAIDVLLKTRQNALVSKHNLYLFAYPRDNKAFYTMNEVRKSVLMKYSQFKQGINSQYDKKNVLPQKIKSCISSDKQYEEFTNKMLDLKGDISENFTYEKWIYLSSFTLDFIRFLNNTTNKDVLNFIFLSDLNYCQIDGDKEVISNSTTSNLTGNGYPDNFFKIKLKNTDIIIILNKQICDTLDLLIQQRHLANIAVNNPFLFATNDSEYAGYHDVNLKFNSNNLDEILKVRSSVIDELLKDEPITKDLKIKVNNNADNTAKLFHYVQMQVTLLSSEFQANSSKDSWLDLLKHLLIYLHLLNTNVPAELENLLISDCQTTLKLEENQDQNEYHFLAELDDFPRNYLLVPTEEESAHFLISLSCWSAMLLILRYRIRVDIDQRNPYMFGCENSPETRLDVQETMKELMVKCGLNSCKYSKARIVNNRIKLVQEIINFNSGSSEIEDGENTKDTTGIIARRRWSKKEVDIVRRELGHFLNDRKLPTLPDCEQVISTNPILRTRSAEQLKAWINNQLQKMPKMETSASENSPQSERIVRLRWSDVEQEIVKKCLGQYLQSGTLPSASECREVIKAYPELSTRNATHLRAWINNQNRKNQY